MEKGAFFQRERAAASCCVRPPKQRKWNLEREREDGVERQAWWREQKFFF